MPSEHGTCVRVRIGPNQLYIATAFGHLTLIKGNWNSKPSGEEQGQLDKEIKPPWESNSSIRNSEPGLKPESGAVGASVLDGVGVGAGVGKILQTPIPVDRAS